jgi:hypothetical protein
MDPFLEHPDDFADVHGSVIVCLKEAINALLPAGYFARNQLRSWVEMTYRVVSSGLEDWRPEPEQVRSNGASTSVLAPTQNRRLQIELVQDERHESYLSIFQKRGHGRKLVTHIEFLSPGNKSAGSACRAGYFQKTAEIIASQVNLVEIDLLRGGTHTTAVPEKALAERVGHYDYHVCIRRTDWPDKLDVFWIRLEDRLPVIEIPLLPDDAPIPVDLQPLLDHAYQAGSYGEDINYNDLKGIVPPLSPAQARRARKLLRTRTGKR